MTTDDRFTCVHCLLSLAWVDGAMQEAERDFMQILTDLLRASELSAEQRAALDLWFTQAPPEPDWAFFEAHPEVGEEILKQATILTCMDMTVTAKELSFLHKLRERIGLDELLFYRIQREAEEVIARQQGLI